MDWTKETFRQAKELEQFIDLLKKFKDMPQIAQLTRTLIDANTGFVGAFDQLCQVGSRFMLTHSNPYNIDSAMHILRAKETERIPAIIEQSAAGAMKTHHAQVKAYAELKDLKCGKNWKKGLQMQLYHRLGCIVQQLDTFKLKLENKASHFEIEGNGFMVAFVLKPVKSLFNERLRFKIAKFVQNELYPHIIGLNFKFYDELLAHLTLDIRNELKPSERLSKSICDSIQLKINSQISKLIKQSYLEAKGRDPSDLVSETGSLVNESIGGSLELGPQDGLTFKIFSYMVEKLEILALSLKNELVRDIVACSANLQYSFIEVEEEKVKLLPGLKEDFKQKYAFLPLQLQVVLKEGDIFFKLAHLTPLLKKNRFQISDEVRMTDILRTIEELRQQQEQLKAQTEPLLEETQKNGRFNFLSKEQNPIIASLRYVGESVKTFILTQLAQALQKEIEMKFWSIHGQQDIEDTKPERITFQNQVLKLVLFDQEVLSVSIGRRNEISSNLYGLQVTSSLFSSLQSQILRDLLCFAISTNKCAYLLDYLSNNTFFSICEQSSLEMHMTNQFKRVSQTERPYLLKQSMQLQNSIQSLMEGYKGNQDNFISLRLQEQMPKTSSFANTFEFLLVQELYMFERSYVALSPLHFSTNNTQIPRPLLCIQASYPFQYSAELFSFAPMLCLLKQNTLMFQGIQVQAKGENSLGVINFDLIYPSKNEGFSLGSHKIVKAEEIQRTLVSIIKALSYNFQVFASVGDLEIYDPSLHPTIRNSTIEAKSFSVKLDREETKKFNVNIHFSPRKLARIQISSAEISSLKYEGVGVMRELFINFQKGVFTVYCLPTIRCLRAILCVSLFLTKYADYSKFFHEFETILRRGQDVFKEVKLTVRPNGWIIERAKTGLRLDGIFIIRDGGTASLLRHAPSSFSRSYVSNEIKSIFRSHAINKFINLVSQLSVQSPILRELHLLMTKQISYPSLVTCNRNTKRTVHLVSIGPTDFLLSYRGHYLLRITVVGENNLLISEAAQQFKEKGFRKISGFELLKIGIENQFFSKQNYQISPVQPPHQPHFYIARAEPRESLFNVNMLKKAYITNPYVPPHSPAAPPSTQTRAAQRAQFIIYNQPTSESKISLQINETALIHYVFKMLFDFLGCSYMLHRLHLDPNFQGGANYQRIRNERSINLLIFEAQTFREENEQLSIRSFQLRLDYSLIKNPRVHGLQEGIIQTDHPSFKLVAEINFHVNQSRQGDEHIIRNAFKHKIENSFQELVSWRLGDFLYTSGFIKMFSSLTPLKQFFQYLVSLSLKEESVFRQLKRRYERRKEEMVRAFQFAHHQYWQRELDFDILFDTLRIESNSADSKVTVKISVFPRAEKINAVVEATQGGDDQEKKEGYKEEKKSVLEELLAKRNKRDQNKQNLQLKYSLTQSIELPISFEGAKFTVGSQGLNRKLDSSDRDQNLVTRVCLLLNEKFATVKAYQAQNQ